MHLNALFRQTERFIVHVQAYKRRMRLFKRVTQRRKMTQNRVLY